MSKDPLWKKKGETIGLRRSYTLYPSDLIDYDIEEGYEVRLYVNVKSEDGSKADIELWGSKIPEFKPASTLRDKKLFDKPMS